MTFRRPFVLFAACLAAALPAAGLNGHFLHGAGATSSALGGVGTGLPTDALNALNTNPALLCALSGTDVEVGVELIYGAPEVDSTAGPFSGTTEDDTGLQPIPAFGWGRHDAGKKIAFGMGAIGLAGFTTDYPQDSRNPVLAPQPVGFGRVSSEYSYLKVPFSLAYQATPKLAIGASLVFGYAQLSANAAPFAAPDCARNGCFYPVADKKGAFGQGFQVGVFYQATPEWSLGAAYSSEVSFEDFEYNSAHANPSLPNFGTARKFDFNVDSPAIASVGLGWRPNSKLSVGLDARWIGYDGVAGLGTFGFNPDGSIQGFGWDDIMVYAVGLEYRPSSKLALRAGYNKSESPIVSSRALASLPAPAVFEQLVSVGASVDLGAGMRLDLGYYHDFEGEVSGPLLGPTGPIPGTSVTHRNSADSVVLTFGFRH